MKKQYLFLVLGAFLFGSVNAQTTITDSVNTGVGYANDVYYSLATGKVSEVANSNWQLGFSIGSFNVAIRANTATGSSSNGKVVMYEMPGVDNNWSPFDTTGYKATWAKLENSDQDWEIGALNQNASGQFDYGWGEYNTSSHVIEGHRLYMAVVTDGASTLYKKVWVRNKTLGTWNISFANVDGTDSVGVTIASSAYTTKNFVYVSLVSGQIVDREPAKNTWDFIYTRYAALQSNQTYMAATGILTNASVLSSKVTGKNDSTTTLADTISMSDNISTIGYSWKALNQQTFIFYIVDSTSYFVKATDGAFWKVVFTGVTNGTTPNTGKGEFTKTKLTPSTGVFTLGEEVKNVSVYPNPASDVLTVLFEAQSASSNVIMTDITGKEVYNQQIESSLFTNHSIDVSNFTKGIYFLSVINGNSRSVQKVIVN